MRERNRGKSAAGAFPCTPGAQGAEAKGAKGATINKRVRDVSLPTLNLLGNSRLLFRVVICRSAMLSVPPPPFPKLKPLLRFGEEE